MAKIKGTILENWFFGKEGLLVGEDKVIPDEKRYGGKGFLVNFGRADDTYLCCKEGKTYKVVGKIRDAQANYAKCVVNGSEYWYKLQMKSFLGSNVSKNLSYFLWDNVGQIKGKLW